MSEVGIPVIERCRGCGQGYVVVTYKFDGDLDPCGCRVSCIKPCARRGEHKPLYDGLDPAEIAWEVAL